MNTTIGGGGRVEITVRLTKADVVKGRLLVYWKSGWGIALAVLGAGFTVNNLVGLHGRHSGSMPLDWLPAFLGLLVVPSAVAFAGLNGPAFARLLGRPLRYDFTERDIHFSSPTVQAVLTWQQVTRAFESRHYFVLATPGAIQVLPKSQIAPLDRARLADLLRSMLGKRARIAGRA
jgi:hypothetical protein